MFQVESCEKAYEHQGFNNNNDFESDISPLDVGHNMYILAHQVRTVMLVVASML